MIVMTRGINNKVAEDTPFAKHVTNGLKKFFAKDWGTVPPEDWEANDYDDKQLNKGEYGRILASYGDDISQDRFWIIRDTEVVTVLFPSEY